MALFHQQQQPKKPKIFFLWWWNESIEINWEHFVLNQYNDWYCSFSWKCYALIMIAPHFVWMCVCKHFHMCVCVCCVSKMHQFFSSFISIRVVNFWYSIINNRIWWRMEDRVSAQEKWTKKNINDWTEKIWIRNRYQDILLLFMIMVLRSMYCFGFFFFFIFFLVFQMITKNMWDISRWPFITCVSCKLTAKYNARHITRYSTGPRIVFNNRWFSYSVFFSQFFSTIQPFMYAYEALEFHIQYNTFVRSFVNAQQWD